METNNQIWLECPSLYLWMNTYIYNNMSAIRDKHEQKHIQNTAKAQFGKNVDIYTFALYIFSSKPTDRQGSNPLFHAFTQFSKQEAIGKHTKKPLTKFFKTNQRETRKCLKILFLGQAVLQHFIVDLRKVPPGWGTRIQVDTVIYR